MAEVPVLDPSTEGAYVIGIDLSLTGTGLAAINAGTGELTTAVHKSPSPSIDSLTAHTARHRALVDGIVSQVVAADPVVAAVEGLQFSVKQKDSSLTRRGFLWWAVVEGLCAAGVPTMEIGQSQIKQFATGRGNAKKDEVVAAYASAWPDAVRGSNICDRADASLAAALVAAWLDVPGLPFSETKVRAKLISRLPQPTLPPRLVRTTTAA